MTRSNVSPPFDLLRLERCAVLLRLGEDAVITETHALEILEQGFELTGRRPYVLLLELTRVKYISSAARRVLASARDVLACGLLGAGPMDRVLAVPYEQAVYPAEYFTDRSTALDWLALMHDILCTDPVEHAMGLTVDLDPFSRRRVS